MWSTLIWRKLEYILIILKKKTRLRYMFAFLKKIIFSRIQMKTQLINSSHIFDQLMLMDQERNESSYTY